MKRFAMTVLTLTITAGVLAAAGCSHDRHSDDRHYDSRYYQGSRYDDRHYPSGEPARAQDNFRDRDHDGIRDGLEDRDHDGVKDGDENGGRNSKPNHDLY